jgi:hypothetical protein
MTAIVAVNSKQQPRLLVVVIVNCLALAMVIINGGDSGHCQWRRWWD